MKRTVRVNEVTPRVGKTIELNMNRSPRSKLQEDCIDTLITSKSHKITVEVKPGVGKTFMALYSISKLRLKPLIVAPTTLLKNQWIEEIETLGIDKNDIASDIFDAPNKKCCVVTVTSMENALRNDWFKLMETIDRSQFGIKIVDEAHLHLKGVLKLDAVCNIKHNWYLSATLGRSSFEEDTILNRAYLDAQRFVGSGIYEELDH